MSEMMGLAGVIDGDVVGTGAWSADTFVTCDRTGRIDAVAPIGPMAQWPSPAPS